MKNKSISLKSAIGIAVALSALTVTLIYLASMLSDSKESYVDITGATAKQVAENANMTFEQFKAEYELPDTVKETTSETETFYSIPVRKIASMYGVTFEELKAKYQWDDSITENTSWGEAEGSTKVSVYLAGSSIENFKAYYGLDESVTGDTLWKDVRNIVDERKKADKESQQSGTVDNIDQNTVVETEVIEDAQDTSQNTSQESLPIEQQKK